MSVRAPRGVANDAEQTYQLLYSNAQRQLKQKDDQIANLEEKLSKGKVQKELQNAARQYRDLQAHLQELEAHKQDETKSRDYFLNEISSRDQQIASLKEEILSNEQLLQEVAANRDDFRQDVELLEEKFSELENETQFLKHSAVLMKEEKEQQDKKIRALEQQLQKYKDGSFVVEKDQEISNLRRGLKEMTDDKDKWRSLHAAIVKDINSVEDERAAIELKHEKENEEALSALQSQIDVGTRLKQDLLIEKKRYQDLLESKAVTDEKLMEARMWNSEYEKGFDLEAAVKEIRQLKIKLQKQSMESAEVQKENNARDVQLQKWVEENRQLRQMCNLPEGWGLDEQELNLHYGVELAKAHTLILQQEKEISELESQRSTLLKELRSNVIAQAEVGMHFLDCNAEQTRKVLAYAERVAAGDDTLPKTDESKALELKVEEMNRQLDTWKNKYYEAVMDLNEAKAELAKAQSIAQAEEFAKVHEAIAQLKDAKFGVPLMEGSGVMAWQGFFGNDGSTAAATQGNPQAPPSGVPSNGQPTPFLQAEALKGNKPGTGAYQALRDQVQKLQQANAGRFGLLDKIEELSLPEKSAVWAYLKQSFGDPVVPTPGMLRVPVTSEHSRSQSAKDLSPQSSKNNLEALDTVPSSMSTPIVQAAGTAAEDLAAEDLPDTLRCGMTVEAKRTFLLCLEDCLSSELLLSRATERIEQQQSLFERLSKQQHVFYEEYSEECGKWAAERVELKKQAETWKDKAQIVEKKMLSLERLRQMETPLPAQHAQLEKEVMAMQFDIKHTQRQNAFLTDELKASRERETRAAEEVLQMESVLRTRLTVAEQRKEAVEGREKALADLIKSWVPREVLFTLSQKHVNLLEEHRELLARHSDLREKGEAHLELRTEHLKLQRDLARVSALLQDQNVAAGNSLQPEIAETSTANGDAMSRLLKTKYERAMLMKTNAEETTQRLLADNQDLERKYQEALDLLAKARTDARNLKADLEGCCDHAKALQLHADIASYRSQVAELQADLKSAKMHTSIASEHARQLSGRLELYDPDSKLNQTCLELVRKMLDDFQSQGDEQHLVGKVTAQLIQEKHTREELRQQCVKAKAQIDRLEITKALLQEEIERHSDQLFRLQLGFRNSLADRDSSIVALQTAAVTGMSLEQARILSKGNADLAVRLEKERQASLEAHDKLNQLELQCASLQQSLKHSEELLAALTPPPVQRRGALGDGHDSEAYVSKLQKQISTWSTQIKALKLGELESKHSTKALTSRVAFLEETCRGKDEEISQLHQRIVHQESELKDKEAHWADQLQALKTEQQTQSRRHQSQLQIASSGDKASQPQAIKRSSTRGSDKSRKQGPLVKAVATAFVKSGGNTRYSRATSESDSEEAQVSDSDSMSSSSTPSRDVSNRTRGGDNLTELVDRLTLGLNEAKHKLDIQAKRIVQLEAQARKAEAAHAADRGSYEHSSKTQHEEQTRMLNAAQDAIKNLHKQMQLKNETVESYKRMLEKARMSSQAQKAADDAEIENLNQQLLKRQDETIGKFKNALDYLNDMPQLPHNVVTAERMHEAVSQKEHEIAVLNAEITALTNQVEMARRETQYQRDLAGQAQQVAAAHLDEAKAENARLRGEIFDLVKANEEQKDTLTKQADEERKLEELISTFRKQMKQKEDKLATLQQALLNLKSARLSNEESVADHQIKVEFDSKVRIVELETEKALQREKYEKRLKKLSDQLAELKLAQAKVNHEDAEKALQAAKGLIRERDSEILGFSQQLAESKKLVATLRDKCATLQIDLKAQVVALEVQKNDEKSKEKSKVDPAELNNLRRQVTNLERELKVAQSAQKKPEEIKATPTSAQASVQKTRVLPVSAAEKQASGPEPAKDSPAFAQWEAQKKLEAKAKKLTDRVAALASELEAERAKLEKAGKELAKEKAEKSLLVAQVFKLERSGRKASGADETTTALAADLASAASQATLRTQLAELEDENERLNREIEVKHKPELQKLRAVNLRLESEISSMAKDVRASITDDPALRYTEKKQLESKYAELQNELLDTRTQLHELKYDAMTYPVTLSRLKQRVQDLTKYTMVVNAAYDASASSQSAEAALKALAVLDVLPAELKQAKTALGIPNTTSSKKNLDSVIATLVQVITKLKQDQEGLLKSVQSNTKFVELTKENKRLKKALEDLKAEMEKQTKETAEKLSGRESDEVARLKGEIKQARKATKKESDDAARFKKRVVELEAEHEESEKLIMELRRGSEQTETSAQREATRNALNFQSTTEQLTKKLKIYESEAVKYKRQISDLTKLVELLNSQQKIGEKKQSEEKLLVPQNTAAFEALQEENQKLQAQNDAFRQELGALDENFWGEVLTLKKKYSKAVALLQQSQQTNKELQLALKECQDQLAINPEAAGS